MIPNANEIIGNINVDLGEIGPPSTIYLAFDEYLDRSDSTIKRETRYS